MARILLACAGVAGFLAVGAGAFGAHALRDRLSESMLAAFQTGVLYHLVHAVALVAVAVLAARRPGSAIHVAGWLMVAGIILFSGSLYVMALSDVRGLGAITPLGGLCFLGAWAAIAVASRSRPAHVPTRE
jgi:uncharacterized membrane protein YgdD (TMEM256/DUF423 family)